jgi:hypothetical protein
VSNHVEHIDKLGVARRAAATLFTPSMVCWAPSNPHRSMLPAGSPAAGEANAS